MSEEYEIKQIEFETARNEWMDKYFQSRPQLIRTIMNEKIFESGFRMALDFLQDNQGK